MTFAEYQKIQAVNWSTLKALRQSPRHYLHRLQAPEQDTPQLRLGRAVHCAVLEPDEFPLRYAVYTESKSRGEGARKAWAEFQEANKARTILGADEYKVALAIRDAVRAHPVAWRYLRDGAAEQVLTWTDRTGLPCKARLDWICGGAGAVVDLKTARDVTPRRFASSAASLLYHGQLAFYQLGTSAVHGPGARPSILIAVESAPPHDVVVYRLDDEAEEEGLAIARELLDQLAALRRRPPETWPGRAPEEEQLLTLPRWALPDDDDAADNLGLTIGGGS